MTVNGEG